MPLTITAQIQPESESDVLAALSICEQIAPELDSEAYASLIVYLGTFWLHHLRRENPRLLTQYLELERTGYYRRQLHSCGYFHLEHHGASMNISSESICIVGPQGWGKTTHAEKLAKHFGLTTVIDADENCIKNHRFKDIPSSGVLVLTNHPEMVTNIKTIHCDDALTLLMGRGL